MEWNEERNLWRGKKRIMTKGMNAVERKGRKSRCRWRCKCVGKTKEKER